MSLRKIKRAVGRIRGRTMGRMTCTGREASFQRRKYYCFYVRQKASATRSDLDLNLIPPEASLSIRT
jgi:hypothetical protein